MKLKNPKTVPPTGWVYRDPDTKAVITGASLNELLGQVHRHRQILGLPLHGAQEQMIIDQLCDSLGEEYCEGIGFGDLVHVVAQPIAKAIDAIAGTNIQGCGGCAKRRASLNS